MSFLLFEGDHYYPAGGWEDFTETFETLDAAKAAYVPSQYKWAHVVDTDGPRIVVHLDGVGDWREGGPYA